MRSLRAREGDFIETREGLIFDVKGLVHPPDRVVAYLRYLEDPSGDRRRGDKMYTRVYSLSEREKTLRNRYPQYLFYDPIFGESLQGVPHGSICKVYQPTGRVSELLRDSDLDRVETEALELIQSLHGLSSVDLGGIGLSGSILVDLHTETSDIDVIVYGRENCMHVHEALRQSMGERKGAASPYDLADLKRLFEFRSKDTRMPLGDFIRLEQRKFSQGKYKGRDFFARFLLDWGEVEEEYGDRTYSAVGYSKIKARVEDDTDSIFTPCRYVMSEVDVLGGTTIPYIREIASLRGRFCEQARKGELVVAQGKVEKVVEVDGTEFYRLILGAMPSDFMISEV